MCDAIYIHIPFCIKKCGYCDFLSFEYSENSEVERINYVTKLIEEIKLYPKLNYNTIYFGGGTPSLLTVEEIKRVMSHLTVEKNAEITLEINPQSVDLTKLKKLKEIGINRLSIGVQSFNNEKLKLLERAHDKKKVLQIYSDAREAGFNNISIDLIFATPNQTIDELCEDLLMVEKLDPEHVSIYSLSWEEGTKFMKMLKSGQLSEIDNILEAKMYELIIDKLKKIRYLHYEISNFSKKNYQSKHNIKYWKNMEYIGVGLGASGYYNGVRYKNMITLSGYYDMIKGLKKPVMEEEKVTPKDKLENYYILGLRLLEEGIEVNNKLYLKKVDKLLKKGYLEFTKNRYKLSSKGVMFANDVFIEIIE